MRKAIEFRFTLSNPLEGEVLIDEPVGWNKSSFTLKRDNKYHSLLFEYSTTLKFYYANSVNDGGAEFISFIENKYGPDGEVGIKVEVSYHNSPWEVFFEGRLILIEIVETNKYIECGIEQDDFFTSFNLKSDLRVSFADNISVDGVALQSYTPYDLLMHSKVLVKRTESTLEQDIPFSNPFAWEYEIEGSTFIPPFTPPFTQYAEKTAYLQFSFTPTIDELDDYYNVGAGLTLDIPPEFYGVKEEGRHTFDIYLNFDLTLTAYWTSFFNAKLKCSGYDTLKSGLIENVEVKVYFQVYDEDDVLKFNNNFITVPSPVELEGCELRTITIPNIEGSFFIEELTLNVGDKVKMYAEIFNSGTYDRLEIVDSTIVFDVETITHQGSYMKIKGATFTEDTIAPAMRVHDVLQNCCNKITNRDDSFYSETFGYPEAPYHSYAEKGCYADFVIQNGFNIRAFPWALRPLQLSFVELYDGLDAIFGLSLSLELMDGSWRIRVEKRSYSYTKEAILTLTGVNKIKRTTIKNKFFHQIEVGYKDWQPKDINGLDEPNSKRVFSTAQKTIGETYTAVSSIIASGSLIEVTRRMQYIKPTNIPLSSRTISSPTTDTEFDANLFIVAINHDDPTVCEKNENFSVVNNLLSPETAYNLRLSPTRNLLRQANYINGGLLKKPGTPYRFQSGDGNYLLESSMEYEEKNCPGSFDGDLLIEKQDINWNYADREDVEPLFEPYQYDFQFPLSMEDVALLKANKNKAINVNGDLFGDEYVSVFILELESEPVTGLATFKCIKASTIPFNYVEEGAPRLIYHDGAYVLYEDGNKVLIN